MENLPNDLLLKLLSLLPLDSVLKLRRVSKSWRRLIETPYICRVLHLKQRELNQTKTVSPRYMLVRNHRLHALKVSDQTDLMYGEITNVPSKYRKIKEIQSCNGVVCLHSGYKNVVIWNPLSDKYQELHSPFPQRNCIFVFGFGFDRASYDYKLVAAERFDCRVFKDIVPSAMVYSVKSNRWKRVDGFNYKLSNLRSGVFLGDSLHWLTENKCIIAYNLAIDQFHEIPLPNLYDVNCCSIIGVFSGWLTVTNLGVASYAMKIYGDKASWERVRLDPRSSYVIPKAYVEFEKVSSLEGLYDRLNTFSEVHSYEATFGFFAGKLDVDKGGGKTKRVSKALTNSARNKRAKF